MGRAYRALNPPACLAGLLWRHRPPRAVRPALRDVAVDFR